MGSNNTKFINEDAVAELLTLTCEIEMDGTRVYLNKEGQVHRIHGPAIIYPDGNQYWYKNGYWHREDGPAMTAKNGICWYYVNDKELSKEQFQKWQKKNGIKPIE